MSGAATNTTVGATSGKAKSAFVSVFKNVAPIFVGFGVGWYAWSLADSTGIVDETQKRKLYHHTQVAESVVANWLPDGWAEKLSLPMNPPLLDMNGEAGSSQVPFSEILATCRISEQLDWLLDHLSEEIPYFYIHDLFAAFAGTHEKRWLAQAHEESGAAGSFAASGKRKGVLFTKEEMEMLRREEVVDLTWQRTLAGIIPVATGLRALAVLCEDKDNALWLTKYADLEVDKLAGAAALHKDTSGKEKLTRGQFAEAVLQLLHERHFAKMHDAIDGSGEEETETDVERTAHASRAAVQLLGHVNDALLKEQAVWWRGMFRNLHIAAKPKFAGVPVLSPSCFYASNNNNTTLEGNAAKNGFDAQRTLIAAITEVQLKPQPLIDNDELKVKQEEDVDSALNAYQLCDRTITEHSSWLQQFLEGVRAESQSY